MMWGPIGFGTGVPRRHTIKNFVKNFVKNFPVPRRHTIKNFVKNFVKNFPVPRRHTDLAVIDDDDESVTFGVPFNEAPDETS